MSNLSKLTLCTLAALMPFMAGAAVIVCAESHEPAATAADTACTTHCGTMPATAQRVCRIACVGDMVLGLNYPDGCLLLAENDGAELFDDVREHLVSADIAAGNLEGVLLDSGGEPKQVDDQRYLHLFRMPERYIGHLSAAGFDVLTLANNHARDLGCEGLESTLRVLTSAGVAAVGISGKCETAVVERDSVRYGFCGFAPNKGMCNIHDYALAERLIDELRREHRCNIVIVTFHGGAEGSAHSHVPRCVEEYAGEKRGDVYRFAHHCIDAGADLVFGHGPHVVRGMELYRGRLIAYSLGNFCTPYGVNKHGRNGYAPILCVDMTPDGEFAGGEIVSFVQSGYSGPQADAEQRAAKEIARLSREDFPESPLVINDDGKLSIR
ncbi:MAG: CapA family protein [Alistipes sp.]|nr:CapA family protein [Alistipes sp.]